MTHPGPCRGHWAVAAMAAGTAPINSTEAGAAGLRHSSQVACFVQGAPRRLRRLTEGLISSQQVNQPRSIEFVLLAIDLRGIPLKYDRCSVLPRVFITTLQPQLIAGLPSLKERNSPCIGGLPAAGGSDL